MKMISAPNTANDFLQTAIDATLANPAIGFALVVAMSGLIAVWLVKQVF